MGIEHCEHLDKLILTKPKIIRITTVPQSLWKLLEGQLAFMQNHFDILAISSAGEKLNIVKSREGVRVQAVEITRTINPLKDIFAIIRLVKIFRKEQPDIVHTHTPKAGFVGMIAAKIAGVKIRLHTIAGMPIEVKKGLLKQLLLIVEKITYACATKIFPNSEGMKKFVLDNKLTNPKKVEIIGFGSSNGINLDFFKRNDSLEKEAKEIRKSLDINNQFVFGFVGRLVKDKGIDELLSAFEAVNNVHKNASLILLGKYEDDLNAFSAKGRQVLENHPNIHFLGYQQDVRPYFCAMDCFVFPSYREGLPNVLLQAGALEVPVIASEINGNTDVIENRKNGILVPAQMVDPLQKAMFEMIENDLLLDHIKKESREKIVSKYNRQIIWEGLLAKYQSLLLDSKKGN